MENVLAGRREVRKLPRLGQIWDGQVHLRIKAYDHQPAIAAFRVFDERR